MSYGIRNQIHTTTQPSAATLFLRRLYNRFQQTAIILMYHRVVNLSRDSFDLAVSPFHFAEHMEILRRQYVPIRLQDLSAALDGKSLKRRSVVVTFDDGYSDNFTFARPILETFVIPATIFVVANHVCSDNEFWWDRLERAVMEPPQLPDRLHATIGSEPLIWDAKDNGHVPWNSEAKLDKWSLFSAEDPTPRHRLFRTLYRRLRVVSESERLRALNMLIEWSGVAPNARSEYTRMSPSQVRELASENLIDIGAHTMSHPMLASLTVPEQHHEIQGSKQRLEDVCGREVATFSYPFGFRGEHYTTETVAIVTSAGFKCACSGFPGRIGNGTDPYQLPRQVVFDWDGDTFAKHLREWFGY